MKKRLVTLSHNLTAKEIEMLRHVADHYGLATHDQGSDSSYIWQRAAIERAARVFLKHFHARADLQDRVARELEFAYPEGRIEKGRKSGILVPRGLHKKLVTFCREVGLYRYQLVALIVRFKHAAIFGRFGTFGSKEVTAAQERGASERPSSEETVEHGHVLPASGNFCVEVSITGGSAKLTVRDASNNVASAKDAQRLTEEVTRLKKEVAYLRDRYRKGQRTNRY